MKTFIGSRLSKNNKVFPPKLEFDEKYLTIIQPGVFSSKEKTIPFVNIASVNIECPLVGFSSITIETTGSEEFTVGGFYAEEVKEMKRIILNR
jgi:membrane protein YdbS with pleckstrin-like domain